MRLARVLTLAVVVLLAAAPAGAAPMPIRLTGVHHKRGQLLVSVGIQDIIQPSDAKRLTSGFGTKVFIRVNVVRADNGAIVAQTFRHSVIVYDLWDEKFRVKRTDANLAPQELVAPDVAQAVTLATTLIQFPVADLVTLQPGVAYRVSFRADLNPLAEDVVAEVRRWLARPPGQGRLGPGDSFFGSFVSIFVNPHIEESERRILFVSQPFVEPPR
jgi:hypothetical protein